MILDQDLFKEVQAPMRETEFRAELSQRMWKSEGLFARSLYAHPQRKAGRIMLYPYANAIALVLCHA